MSAVPELEAITRQSVIDALESGRSTTLLEEQKYSVVYKGHRYDPKTLLSLAYQLATAGTVNEKEWADLAYSHFVEALEDMRFRIVVKPRDLAPAANTSMLYEIKKSSQGNYDRLFSNDRSYFYWNQTKFAKLELGDYVYIANPSRRECYFGQLDKSDIPTHFDEAANITRFTDNSEEYEVAGEWEVFVRIRIVGYASGHETWKFKSLGSSEHTYLKGNGISAGTAENNLLRINQLLEIFPKETEADFDLQACFDALSAIAPKADILAPVIDEREPKLWYVMQGQTFNEGSAKSSLWAPIKDKRGSYPTHWKAMEEVQAGDIIIHHADSCIRGISRAITSPVKAEDPFNNGSWRGIGHRVDIERLVEFTPPIPLDVIRKLQQPLANALEDVRGPYNAAGSGNQGYLFEFTWEAFAILLKETDHDVPDDLAQWLPEVDINEEENDESVITGPILPSKTTDTPSYEWLKQVQQYIASKGFHYTLPDIANFYTSLRTKPFLILAGISGTGKTQIVRQFAKAIGYGDERHCVLIPVRPDWADNSDLIGYRNIEGKYQQQKLLKVLQDAMKHPDEPFFVILDEMNLARVEHYFSDFLSLLETREYRDGVIVSDAVVNDPTVNSGQAVTIPQNVMLIGTVNMDETTHPFSRKVLDRANAIEMNEVNLDWITQAKETVESVPNIFADAFVTPYLNSIDLSEQQKIDLRQIVNLLIQINQALEPAGLHFGYRVRDEVAFYIANHQDDSLGEKGILTKEDALDYQLMQKVLPRIQGSSSTVFRALVSLLKLLSGAAIDANMEFQEIGKTVEQQGVHTYPRSVKKLLFMLRRYNDDGFTSFWL